MTKTSVVLPGVLLLSGLAGCARIDYDYPRSESYHLADTADTGMGQKIEPIVATRPPDQSGFYPMVDGVEALTVRAFVAELDNPEQALAEQRVRLDQAQEEIRKSRYAATTAGGGRQTVRGSSRCQCRGH
jgi:hypothetical protein